MKTATRKYSQKGLSPIIIVVILAVIGIGAFVLYNSKTTQNSQSTSSQTNSRQTEVSSKSIAGLEKIETDKYTFYYPKGYVKTDKELPKGNTDVVYLYLKDNAAKDEGIKMSIEHITTRSETPTTESCQLLAKISTRGLNPTFVDVRPVDYIKSHGCVIWYTVNDSNNVKWQNYARYFSYKEGNDTDSYDIRAAYHSDTPEEEQDKIKLSVDNFMLK